MRNEPRTFWTTARYPARALLISVVCTLALAQQVPSDPGKSAPEPAATEPPPRPGQPAATEPPPNASAPTDQGQTGSDSPASADKADKAGTAETDETAPPVSTPDKPAASKGSPQHFEPTEKVRPDFDVAFPVDI